MLDADGRCGAFSMSRLTRFAARPTVNSRRHVITGPTIIVVFVRDSRQPEFCQYETMFLDDILFERQHF